MIMELTDIRSMSISVKDKKQEAMYNTKSLVSTWLDGYTKISDLVLVFDGQTTNCTIPCEIGSCGSVLSEILLNNTNNYTHVKLIGKVGGRDKVFGELDIEI